MAGLSRKVTEGQQWGAPLLGLKECSHSWGRVDHLLTGLQPTHTARPEPSPQEMKTGPWGAQWGLTIRPSGPFLWAGPISGRAGRADFILSHCGTE